MNATLAAQIVALLETECEEGLDSWRRPCSDIQDRIVWRRMAGEVGLERAFTDEEIAAIRTAATREMRSREPAKQVLLDWLLDQGITEEWNSVWSTAVFLRRHADPVVRAMAEAMLAEQPRAPKAKPAPAPQPQPQAPAPADLGGWRIRLVA